MTALKAAREALEEAVRTLELHGVDTPRADARILLSSLLDTPLSRLDLELGSPLPSDQYEAFCAAVRRRMEREPLAYITGDTEFMGLRFRCDPRALVPRPETEVLVEQVLERLEAQTTPAVVLDLGTGCGAIGLSLGALLRDIRVLLTDVSDQAIAVARENAQALGLADRVALVQGADLTPVCQAGLAEEITCLVSNPPYVPARDLPELPPEVALHEPREAWLGAGDDGLGFYERVIPQAAAALPGLSLVALEVGIDQARRVMQICSAAWPSFGTVIVNDLSGIERVVIAEAHDE